MIMKSSKVVRTQLEHGSESNSGSWCGWINKQVDVSGNLDAPIMGRYIIIIIMIGALRLCQVLQVRGRWGFVILKITIPHLQLVQIRKKSPSIYPRNVGTGLADFEQL